MTLETSVDLPVPASHVDLLRRPIWAVLTTLGPSGHPESSLVWIDTDGTHARFGTTLERRKGRNLVARPRLSLLVVDPDDTSRFLQIRGTAELVRDGAIEHLDGLTRAYTNHPAYYGFIAPMEQRASETRVTAVIHADRIALDAIHH
jgi:PPOX class probable F420-dependent enzyme